MTISLAGHIKFVPYCDIESNIAALLFCSIDILGALTAKQAGLAQASPDFAPSWVLQAFFVLALLLALVFIVVSAFNAIHERNEAVGAVGIDNDEADMFAEFSSLEKKLLFPVLVIVWLLHKISHKIYNLFCSKRKNKENSSKTKIVPQDEEKNTEDGGKMQDDDIRSWGRTEEQQGKTEAEPQPNTEAEQKQKTEAEQKPDEAQREATTEEMCDALLLFYSEVCPERATMESVQKTLKSFIGRENKLHDGIKKKYGRAPEALLRAPGQKKSNSNRNILSCCVLVLGLIVWCLFYTDKTVTDVGNIVDGTINNGTDVNAIAIVDKGESGCGRLEPCDLCHGSCDDDRGCKGSSICFKTKYLSSNISVPGCESSGMIKTEDWNYDGGNSRVVTTYHNYCAPCYSEPSCVNCKSQIDCTFNSQHGEIIAGFIALAALSFILCCVYRCQNTKRSDAQQQQQPQILQIQMATRPPQQQQQQQILQQQRMQMMTMQQQQMVHI